jgi:branched-chain amino acid transport system ATP-binding protein
VELGINHVPEGRGIFTNLTVWENLMLATYTRKDRSALDKDFSRCSGFSPIEERSVSLRDSLGRGTADAGRSPGINVEGRYHASDEPSMGLAPVLVDEIFRSIRDIKREGKTILLVEQNAYRALEIAHRGYVFETGNIVYSGTAQELQKNEAVKKAYLGG